MAKMDVAERVASAVAGRRRSLANATFKRRRETVPSERAPAEARGEDSISAQAQRSMAERRASIPKRSPAEESARDASLRAEAKTIEALVKAKAPGFTNEPRGNPAAAGERAARRDALDAGAKPRLQGIGGVKLTDAVSEKVRGRVEIGNMRRELETTNWQDREAKVAAWKDRINSVAGNDAGAKVIREHLLSGAQGKEAADRVRAVLTEKAAGGAQQYPTIAAWRAKASGSRRMAEEARARGGTLGGPANAAASAKSESRMTPADSAVIVPAADKYMAERKAAREAKSGPAVPGSYVPGSARKSDDAADPVEAKDTTGDTVRVFETRGNIAVTDKGPRHTTKLFPEGKGGKSMASMGYSEGQHDMTRESRRSGGGLRDWNEADHPRDEGGQFTNK